MKHCTVNATAAIKCTCRETHNKTFEKYVHSFTQNFNKALNNVIWTSILKNKYAFILKAVVWDVINTYNTGAIGKVKVLERL